MRDWVHALCKVREPRVELLVQQAGHVMFECEGAHAPCESM
jgi:hypothetical protein